MRYLFVDLFAQAHFDIRGFYSISPLHPVRQPTLAKKKKVSFAELGIAFLDVQNEGSVTKY